MIGRRCHSGPQPPVVEQRAERADRRDQRPLATERSQPERTDASRHRGEQGSATVFVIGFAIVLFLCAGLVIDGGLAINKRMRIADDAEQAARIGADSIDVNEFRRTETLVIDEALARQRISGYMADLGYGGDQFTPDIDADRVGIQVRDTSKTYILNLFGIRFPVRASAEAVPDTGQPAPGQPAPAP